MEKAGSRGITRKRLSRRTRQLNGTESISNNDIGKALNNLARHQTILRVLADIRLDMEICEIEGWNKTEYLDQLAALINSFRTNEKG